MAAHHKEVDEVAHCDHRVEVVGDYMAAVAEDHTVEVVVAGEPVGRNLDDSFAQAKLKLEADDAQEVVSAVADEEGHGVEDHVDFAGHFAIVSLHSQDPAEVVGALVLEVLCMAQSSAEHSDPHKSVGLEVVVDYNRHLVDGDYKGLDYHL